MDIYCINIFCDDRDFDLKPWQQNGGIVYEEDKVILREMWRMHNEAQGMKNRQIERDNERSSKDGSGKTRRMIRRGSTSRDAAIKQKLASLGYGIPRMKRKPKK